MAKNPVAKRYQYEDVDPTMVLTLVRSVIFCCHWNGIELLLKFYINHGFGVEELLTKVLFKWDHFGVGLRGF